MLACYPILVEKKIDYEIATTFAIWFQDRQKEIYEELGSKSVVKDWLINNCSWRQQTNVLMALRCCDFAIPKEDPTKKLSRMLRSIVLVDMDQSTGFMEDDITNEEMNAFLGYIDVLPVRYIIHFIQASAIIGYHHPIEAMADFWKKLYFLIVKTLHLKPETKEEIDYRLRDVFR